MTPDQTRKVLAVQRRQFKMALDWLDIIESETSSLENKRIASEQYALLLKSIYEVLSTIGEEELVC